MGNQGFTDSPDTFHLRMVGYTSIKTIHLMIPMIIIPQETKYEKNKVLIKT